MERKNTREGEKNKEEEEEKQTYMQQGLNQVSYTAYPKYISRAHQSDLFYQREKRLYIIYQSSLSTFLKSTQTMNILLKIQVN